MPGGTLERKQTAFTDHKQILNVSTDSQGFHNHFARNHALGNESPGEISETNQFALENVQTFRRRF